MRFLDGNIKEIIVTSMPEFSHSSEKATDRKKINPPPALITAILAMSVFKSQMSNSLNVQFIRRTVGDSS